METLTGIGITMRKAFLTLAIFGIFTGALASNCKHLWYSESQQMAQFVENDTSKVNVNIGRLILLICFLQIVMLLKASTMCNIVLTVSCNF